MKTIADILSLNSHRPWPLPHGSWRYYQEWNDALFLHWKVPVDALQEFIPAELQIDLFENNAWVSLVAFTMENIRPRFLPAVNGISNFHEINLRTYVNYNNKPGVYFLNIEAANFISAFIAKTLSGLPYETADMARQNGKYVSYNKAKKFKLETGFVKGNSIEKKSELDKWLTERYCLYLKNTHILSRYQIHHAEWDLQALELQNIDHSYPVGNLNINRLPDMQHYSKGVKVIAWGKENLK